ncbi:MAG: arsenate reductase ArsC [Gammaproteobacteria bacterium]|nr:arsenate reductase ArsC [Gammaproteobacteria bacterium]
MNETSYNILFLCTGNSARSIMAEALLNHHGGRRFKGYSAGSTPVGKVNPFAIEMIERLDVTPESFRSKSWEEFERDNAPPMDIIITVCDNAAGESCPVWPGHPVTAHWSFPDPAAATGSDEEKREAFRRVFREIRQRIELLVQLPIGKLDQLALREELDQLAPR